MRDARDQTHAIVEAAKALVDSAQAPRLQNDPHCVEWDVKLYYTIPSRRYAWLCAVGVSCFLVTDAVTH